MSMIARYKKKGGFQQLLNLIETCGIQKQEKFLKMIEEEDLRWAEAVRSKMLTIKRIFSWEENAINEIAAKLHDLTLGTAICGFEPMQLEKINKCMNHARKRKIEDIMAEKKPSQAEISTAYTQILTEVRKMIDDGLLNLERIDSELIANSDFEDALLSGGPILKAVPESAKTEVAPPFEMPSAVSANTADKGEVEHLRKVVAQITIENQKLKERLVAAESKLAQIKKIA